MQMMWYHSQFLYGQVVIRKSLKPSQEIQKISYQKAVLSSVWLSDNLTCLSATTFLDIISSERLGYLWRCLLATGFFKNGTHSSSLLRDSVVSHKAHFVPLFV